MNNDTMSFKNGVRNLIDFNAIFDVDLGILLTVYDKYHSHKAFHLNIMDNTHDRISLFHMTRTSENVLTLITDNPSSSLESEIYQENMDYIFKVSRFSDISSIALNASVINEVRIDILCKNTQEEQFITESFKLYPRVKAVLVYEGVFKSYDYIILARLSDLIKHNLQLASKTVYLLKTAYNLDYNEETQQFELNQDVINNFIAPNLISIYLIDQYKATDEFYIGG